MSYSETFEVNEAVLPEPASVIGSDLRLRLTAAVLDCVLAL